VRFRPANLQGVYVLELEKFADERGYFARTFCEKEFLAHGLETRFVQCSVSFNYRKGTLRGMHYQASPFEETKLVRCNRGAIYDVVIDLRRDSATFKKFFAVELNEKSGQMLYIPKGFAHGFQTLVDNSEVCYQISEFYSPTHARGVRWDDPVFGIPWPQDERTILERDRNYSDFE
jgi:dTDP-4-dehydrorhamnose 3,5-epimerase